MKVRRKMSRNARDIFSQGTWILSRASRDISRWNILAVSRLCQCETIQWHFRYTWKRTRAISRSWIFQPFHLIRTKKMIFSQCLEFHWKISHPRWPVPSPSLNPCRGRYCELRAVFYFEIPPLHSICSRVHLHIAYSNEQRRTFDCALETVLSLRAKCI